jgi:hypothetical protein
MSKYTSLVATTVAFHMFSKLGDWFKLQTPLHKEYKNKIGSWKASEVAFNQKSPHLQL